MTELDAYLEFRKEIDSMFFPKLQKLTDITTMKDEAGNVISLMIVEDGYIDALWVDEKWRGNGLGYKTVIQHVIDYGTQLKTLRILNNNKKAYVFWNKVFRLETLEANPYDTLYLIHGFVSREYLKKGEKADHGK